MTEFCLLSTSKVQFSSLVLSDLVNFCFFVLSNPLYFSYFIFFSPYLLKLLSFLSPLFITTSLLLAALLTTVSLSGSPQQFPEPRVSYFFTACTTCLDSFCSAKAEDGKEELRFFEQLEVYKIVFEASAFEISEFKTDESCVHVQEAECAGFGAVDASEEGEKQFQDIFCYLDENSQSVEEEESDKVEVLEELVTQEESKEKTRIIICETPLDVSMSTYNGRDRSPEIADIPRKVGHNLENSDGDEQSAPKVFENLEKPDVHLENSNPSGEQTTNISKNEQTTNISKNSKKLGKIFENSVAGSEYASKVSEDFQRTQGNIGNGGEYPQKTSENLQTIGSFGSMRKEKEWKRTLACKLFEERHNVEGGEGMDLLWETYEADSGKLTAKGNVKKGKKGQVDEEDEDEDEDEEMNGQLCCLQALKLSTGKMNLGMGRPNLVKISKALKGFGWLHHVSRSGKRVYG